jgi:K+-transporting ATPase ATPase A chain
MTANGILQILFFFLLVLLVTKPLGHFMARVFEGEKTLLDPVLKPIERALYRVCGIDEKQDMKWTTYAFAMLMFSVVGIVLTYVLLRVQGSIHFAGMNPKVFSGKDMPPDLSFNTAISFATNTNWQNYSPELTVSYFTNMVSLAIHNWMSAATGIAVAIALVRGFARRSAEGIGNFWVDLTRATMYILAPIALVFALVLVQQGVPQNFNAYTSVKTVDAAAATNGKDNTQTIAQGPVASQEAIKMLGTNGGGFFNANSAHPYENPTPLANLLQLLSIFAIPAALTYTFGHMVKNTKQGWAIFAAMSSLFFIGAFVCVGAEQKGTPNMDKFHVMTTASATQPGGNMEGKETRFGITNSALFATVTTDASCGAVNSMHDSYTPLGGLVPLANILSGEVIFGGTGAGLYGMLMYAVIAVFIAGLMVGRTPEYLGKKIEQYEVKMAMLAVLVLAADILFFAALDSNLQIRPLAGSLAVTDANKAAVEAQYGDSPAKWNRLNNAGLNNGASDTFYGPTYNNQNNSVAHGFSEIFYAAASTTGNNGSAFAGLTGNTPYYNLTLGIGMLIGRFLMIIPLLAIAGSLAKKKAVPESAGTFPTDSATFTVLLIGVIVIVGALTFFPALSLGPIVEHFQMNAGRTF